MEILHKQTSLFTEEKSTYSPEGFHANHLALPENKKENQMSVFLWFDMLRAIREIRPNWVVAENVTNLIELENGKTFEKICASLENEGYTVQPYIIPAGAVKGWHVRNRLWILANSSGQRIQRNKQRPFCRKSDIQKKSNGRSFSEITDLSDEIEPFFSGASDGVSTKLYNECIKAYGNAIVPQVAYEIFKAIQTIHEQTA